MTIREPENVNENRTIDHDEIQNFIDTRYVGPLEAVYRILSNPL